MSTTYVNPASNLSYVSKDFLTVFPDLLNLAKLLSSRWDPSISNEADPGVVLLKLNAIIADKLNYNIDKNILEAFPMSLTLMGSARKIYNMLGYKMAWYKSAEAVTSLTWSGETNTTGYIRIPAFTMLSDDATSLVYSIIAPCASTDTDISIDPLYPSANIRLYYDNTLPLIVKVMLGVAVNYSINGEEVIKVSDLDSENRIYFSTTDVALNGVFICNNATEENRVYDWKRVDNLLIQKLGEKNFEFGITDDGYSCYIEFPEDAEEQIKDGIRIVYLRTSGAVGNVAINTIDKFYTDTYLTDSIGEAITLSASNVTIANTSAAIGGADPESVNDAYKSYKKIVGTFDTLITLRDYINAIMTSNLVSNGFVCDKTNDIQCTYNVKAIINGVDTDRIYIETNPETKGKQIGSLNIKLYLLQKVDPINSNNFTSSFELIPDDQLAAIKAYIDTKKHIGHDYSNLLQTTVEAGKSHPCMFINKYKIIARIYCKLSLTTAEKEEVKENIVNNLCDCLNAAQIEFSETITVDRINQIILDADSKIKSVNIDDLDYTTYARYYYSYIRCTNIIDETNNIQCGNYITKDLYTLMKGKCPYCGAQIEWPKDDDIYQPPVYDFMDVAIGKKDDTIKDAITNIPIYSADEYSSENQVGYSTGELVLYNGRRFRCLADKIKIPPYATSTVWKLDEYLCDIDYTQFITKLSTYNSTSDLFDGALNYNTPIIANYKGTSSSEKTTKTFICEDNLTKFILPSNTIIIEQVRNCTRILDEDEYIFDQLTHTLILNEAPTKGELLNVIYINTLDSWEIDCNGSWEATGDGKTTEFNIDEKIIKNIGTINTVIVGNEILDEAKYTLDLTNKKLIFNSIVPPKDANIIMHYSSLGKVYTTAELETEFGIKLEGSLQFNETKGESGKGDKLIFYISKSTLIRDEVYTKSILAGKTPLIDDDETVMDFNFTNPFSKVYPEIQKISGETTLVFEKEKDYECTINPNEIAEFYAPEFYEITNYGAYVKYEAYLKRTLTANACTQLVDDEYIVFYYRPKENTSGTYQYHFYGKGAIICPAIDISVDTTHVYADLIKPALSAWKPTKTGGYTYYEAYSAYNGQMTLELSENIANKLTGSGNVLNADAKVIYIKGPMQVTLNSKFYCYWILNNNSDIAVLFDEGEDTKILGNGEYFIYTTAALQDVEVLGQGTKITRATKLGIVSVPATISYEDLLTGGLSITSGNLYNPTSELTCTKNLSIYLGEGCQIKLLAKEELPADEYDYIYIKADGTYRDSIEHGPMYKDDSLLLKFDISYNTLADTDYPNKLDYISYLQEYEESGEIKTKTVGWEALSILLLNMSLNVGLILYEKLLLNLKDVTYTEDDDGNPITGLTVITGKSTKKFLIPEINKAGNTLHNRRYSFNYYPCKVFSDIDIYLSNSGEYSVYKLTDLSEIKYGTLSEAKLTSTSDITAVTPLTNGALTLSITPTTLAEYKSKNYSYNTVYYPISMAAGNYLAKVTSSSTETVNVNLYLSEYIEEIFIGDAKKTAFSLTKANSTVDAPPFVLVDNKEANEDYYPYVYTYNNGIGTITFINDAPLKDIKIRIATNYFNKISNSDFLVASSELSNLNTLTNTPVKFTIPVDRDPESYVLPIFLTAVITLKDGLQTLSSTETINISNPKKYVPNTNLVDTTVVGDKQYVKYEKYRKLLKILDKVDGPLFNYMYNINDNELITNPLSPTSFLNLSHPFYKYTICLYICSDTSGIEILERK